MAQHINDKLFTIYHENYRKEFAGFVQRKKHLILVGQTAGLFKRCCQVQPTWSIPATAASKQALQPLLFIEQTRWKESVSSLSDLNSLPTIVPCGSVAIVHQKQCLIDEGAFLTLVSCPNYWWDLPSGIGHS
jgi:hypothetical protein